MCKIELKRQVLVKCVIIDPNNPELFAAIDSVANVQSSNTKLGDHSATEIHRYKLQQLYQLPKYNHLKPNVKELNKQINKKCSVFLFLIRIFHTSIIPVRLVYALKNNAIDLCETNNKIALNKRIP